MSSITGTWGTEAIEEICTKSAFSFLRECCAFLVNVWPHLPAESLPDAGFEMQLRAHCGKNLRGWIVAPEREFRFGEGLAPASGVCHEVDIVVRNGEATCVAELKRRLEVPVEKNEVVVFFAKVVDYLALNPSLLLKDLCLAFVTSLYFEPSALGACLGLGIHPIAPDVRPIPLLVDAARLMALEIERQPGAFEALYDAFDAYSADLADVVALAQPSWPNTRFVHQSQHRIGVNAVSIQDTEEIGREVRRLTGVYKDLRRQFIEAKTQA